MPVCLIALGSNLGDRRQTLQRAIAHLAGHPRVELLAASGFRETLPVGGPSGQGPFLNAAATLQTSLGPDALLALLEETEKQLGRVRGQRWAPRSIDLDLLLYDQVVMEGPGLILPHPRMAWRRFVLEPAAEVAPTMVHPTTGWTIARLLHQLGSTPFYVALAGPIGVGKTHLAEALAAQTAAERLQEEVDPRQLAEFYADPAGGAWPMEIQFLAQRGRLLAADHPRWSRRDRLVVSDFWFEQSMAFAGVWLPPKRRAAFQRLWNQTRRSVVEPRLIVLLEAPPDRLLARIRDRGRPGERELGPAIVERIRQAILARANRTGHAPVLRSTYDESGQTLSEVLAAVEAMK